MRDRGFGLIVSFDAWAMVVNVTKITSRLNNITDESLEFFNF